MLFGNICLAFTMKMLTKLIYDHEFRSVQDIIGGSFYLTGDKFALQHLMKQNQVNLEITNFSLKI